MSQWQEHQAQAGRGSFCPRGAREELGALSLKHSPPPQRRIHLSASPPLPVSALQLSLPPLLLTKGPTPAPILLEDSNPSSAWLL